MNDAPHEIKAFIYELCKSIGILWLVDKVPFLEKKQWVKDYENE